MESNSSGAGFDRGQRGNDTRLEWTGIPKSSKSGWLLLQAALDSLSAHIAVLDTRGIIVAVNRQWAKFGRQNGLDLTKDGIGTDYVAALPQTHDMTHLRKQLTDVLIGKDRGFRHSYWCDAPDGARYYEMQVRRYGRGAWRRVLVAHEDVTELKQAEDTLKELAGELERAREDERRRLAKELHDTTCQDLLAASLTAQRLKGRLVDDADAHEAMEELKQSLGRAMRDLRTLSYLLHTPTSSASIADAARALTVGFGERAGLQVRFASDYSGGCGERTERALLSALREALTNIYRHSGSNAARVELSSKDKTLELAISDRGQWREGSEGVGLASMRERLAEVGGTVMLHRTRRGTRLSAQVPLTASSQT